jgi:hypothetical protein
MSKSYFGEPRRGPVALEPWGEPYMARGSTVPSSGPADPRQRVRNDRRDAEPYRDLRVEPNLTGTWFERRGRYRLFINHVGGHLECLLTLVVEGYGYHKQTKSLAADERLPLDWGISGYCKTPPGHKYDPIAFRFAGDWSSTVYMLTVPVWLGDRPHEPSPESIDTHDLGFLAPRASGDQLDVDFLGWFVARWPEAKEVFRVKQPGDGEAPPNLRTVAERVSTQPVLLDRYLARPSVPYEVRTHYWFPMTPKQRAGLPELAKQIRYETVRVDPELDYRPLKQGPGGRVMDVYDLLQVGRSLGIRHDDTHARNNIVTAIDRIVGGVFERAASKPPHEGGLGADELVHLRPYVLRFLDGWCLAPTEDQGRQTLATALQRLVDRASYHGAEYSHLEKHLGISPRGWRGFGFEVEVTAFEAPLFDDGASKDAYETGRKVFDRLQEKLEEEAKKRFKKFGKFKTITKYLPVTYLVGHVRVKYLGVVEGNAGGPQEEPWEAWYGFALGGVSVSKGAGDAQQEVKMSGTTVLWAGTPPVKEDLEGVLQYLEGDLFAGIGLGADEDEDEDRLVKNPSLVVSKSMLTFYGGKQSPAVSFTFGATLSGGISGGEAGVQGLVGTAWLLDGEEGRLVLEPKEEKEEKEFESYWQDHVPSLAVHFPINGARLPVPTEAERRRMQEQGTISVKEALDAFAACELPLMAHPAARIVIDGYADAPGDEKKNLQLSLNRARSVYHYLESILGERFMGGAPSIDPEATARVILTGHGEPPKGQEMKPGTKEVFDPKERRTDIKISLSMGKVGTEDSLEWQLRRVGK